MEMRRLQADGLAGIVLSLALAACASQRAQGQATETAQPAATSNERASATAAERATTIRISEDVRRRCNLQVSTENVPNFDYDRTALHPHGRDVLNDVANCLTDGPLSGQVITVVGRADPRGSEEHNDALGAGRAMAARDYLAQRGVSADRIRLVSRGEHGARGTDEASYALDRRVDIELGDVTNHPIVEGTMKQIETSRAKQPVHPEAASYADTAEGAKPASNSGTGAGASSESVHVGGEVQGSASTSAK